MNRELRQRIRQHVQVEGPHWAWLGNVDKSPRLWDADRGVAISARKAIWEEYGGQPVRRLVGTCGEPSCVRPEHMRPWGRDACIRGHQSERYPSGGCKACWADKAVRRYRCPDCLRTMVWDWQWGHRDVCPGEPDDTTPAPVAELRATQDAVDDCRKGMTPERICEAYAVQPDMLAKRLHRQPERTPTEQQLMRQLFVLANQRKTK